MDEAEILRESKIVFTEYAATNPPLDKQWEFHCREQTVTVTLTAREADDVTDEIKDVTRRATLSHADYLALWRALELAKFAKLEDVSDPPGFTGGNHYRVYAQAGKFSHSVSFTSKGDYPPVWNPLEYAIGKLKFE